MRLSKHSLVLICIAAIALSSLISTAAISCESLHDKVFSLDLKAVTQLIRVQKCNINLARASDQYTPLHAALERIGINGFSHQYDKKTASMIKFLVAAGANVKLPFPKYAGITGYTPLHFAAYDGNMVLAPLFVKHGAKVNAKDERGFTPLHSAARCDFRLSCDDCTPLKGKVSEARKWKLGARPVIKYLQSKGAYILAKTKIKQTVLDILPTPCTWAPPASACKEWGVKRCSDMCTAAGEKLTWPSGTCQKTYFYVKAAMAAASKKN